MIKGWATFTIGLLAVVAILVGLALTGGPGQARKERRDRERESDLSSIGGLVDCLARENGNRLPKVPEATAQCDWQVRLADPFTGQPYVYEVTGLRSYRLCAGFELPADDPPGRNRPDAQGCISREFVPVVPDPPGAAATIPYR